MFRIHYVLLLVVVACLPVTAEVLRVPRDHATIQTAIDASAACPNNVLQK